MVDDDSPWAAALKCPRARHYAGTVTELSPDARALLSDALADHEIDDLARLMQTAPDEGAAVTYQFWIPRHLYGLGEDHDQALARFQGLLNVLGARGWTPVDPMVRPQEDVSRVRNYVRFGYLAPVLMRRKLR